MKNQISDDAKSVLDVPESFEKFPVGIPPMFLKMADYAGSSRFVGINYFGSKATWHDGRGSTTFSYFSVYAPLIGHPAIAYVLKNRDLGTDDSQPTHTIIFDTENDSIYLAVATRAAEFLSAQHPAVQPVEITNEMWREIKQEISSKMNNLADMQRAGMFEFFAPVQDRMSETESLIKWLDENTSQNVRDHFARLGYSF